MIKELSVSNLKEKFFHPGFQRYFKNTGWLFFGQLFNLVVAFFVGAYVARYLGPTNFGLMNYAISFASLFGFLAGFGVDNILNRELIKSPEKRSELLGAAFWLKIIGSLAAIIIINLVAYLINAEILARVLILVFSLTFFFQSLAIIAIYFHARVLSKKVILAQFIVTLISTLLKLAFIYYQLGVIWIISVYVADSLILGVGLLIIYGKNNSLSFLRSCRTETIRKLLKDSWPLMFTAAAIAVYTKIDQIFIKELLDATSVGLYAVSVRLTEILYFIPSLICASLFPAIINAKHDQKNYRLRIKRLVLLMVVIAIGAAAVSSLVAKPLIAWLFGTAYLPSLAAFRIYIWSIVPSFVMVAANYYLIAENATLTYLAIAVIGAVANIVLNIMFIPTYGIIGGAVATLISYSLIPLSLLLFPKIRRGFRTQQI